MKRIDVILLLFGYLLFASGCSAYYPDMTGTVIDAETGQPIEGAVVLVEWTKTKGVGLTHTESYKVQEVVTDNAGHFAVSGLSDLFVNAPDVTVYKKGYVCWNNKYIFPDYKPRNDFKWGHTYIIKVAKFTDKDSYNDHVTFIEGSIRAALNYEAKKIMYHAFEWELDFARKERVSKGLSP